MPVKTKRDEEKWQKAKEIAEKAGKGENYAYIMGIYKKMKPDYEFKSKKGGWLEDQQRKHSEKVWKKMRPRKGGYVNLTEWFGDVWAEVKSVFPPSAPGDQGALIIYHAKRRGGTEYVFPYKVREYSAKLPSDARLLFNSEGEFGGRNSPPIPDSLKTAATKYDHIDFKPPAGAASAAKKGLEYRKKQKGDKAGLTPAEAAREGIGSGVQRATNLKNRDTLSPKVVKQMKAFFARHQKNKTIAPEHKDEPWNDKGYVSWLLWGGDAGQAWAEKVVSQMEAADKKAKTAAERVATRYLTAISLRKFQKGQRKYQDYVDEKKRKGEKPLSKEDWEKRHAPKEDEAKKETPKAEAKGIRDALPLLQKAETDVAEAKEKLKKVEEKWETGIWEKGSWDPAKEWKEMPDRIERALKAISGEIEEGTVPQSVEALLQTWDKNKPMYGTHADNEYYRAYKPVIKKIKKIKKMLEKGKSKKAAERVAARYLSASKLTSRDIEKWLKKQRTWFEITDVDRTGASLDSREYGDVGAERPGRADYQEAMRLGKLALAEFGADQINVTIEAIDEWINLKINLGGKGQKTPEVWL